MENPPHRKHNLSKSLFVLVILTIVSVPAFVILRKHAAGIPDKYKNMANPVAASSAALQEARANYKNKCVECHGETGKGDGPEAMMYDPAPADLTDSKTMQTKSDGEFYYQITEGRKPMPSFKNRLTEEQRWELVLLVRSFAAKAADSGSTGAK